MRRSQRHAVHAPRWRSARDIVGFGHRGEETGMHKPADRIRNVALVGHRGSGKTSLHEALLFEAGAINRLGSVVGRHDRLRHRPRRAGAPDVDLGDAGLVRVAGAQDQPDRHARRLELRRRRARRAARVRVGGVRDQRRDGRRGPRPAGCGSAPPSSTSRACCSSTCSTASAPTSSARSSRSRPRSASTWSRPRSRSAPSTRSAGVIDLVDMKAYALRRRRPRQLRARSRSPTSSQAQAAGVPREADGRGRRESPTR